MLGLNFAELLLLVIMLQQGVAAALWVVAARMGVVPMVPALHWAAAAFWATGTVALTLFGQGAGSWLSHQLANMVLPGIFVLLRLGLQILLRSPRHDGEALLVIVVSVLCGVGGNGADAPLFWSVAYSALLCAFLLIRTTQTIRQPARQELGVAESRLLIWPLRFLALVFAARLVITLVQGVDAATPLYVDTPANVVLLVVFMTLGMLIHLLLGLSVALRLVHRLHRLSRQDALTGLPNRRACDEHWQHLQERLSRGQGGYALMLVDADHFKRVNDELGHAIGDRVLVNLCERLQAELRAVDWVGRFGGEEFIVLAPDVDALGAETLAERLRRSVELHPLRLGRQVVPVTVSIGWGLAQADEPAAHLLSRADAALYAAKAAGRNRTMAAP